MEQTTRLITDGYQRPKLTYTDSLQDVSEIEKKLDGYIEIDESDVDSITPNSFIRYIKYDKKNKTEKFITGGTLLRVTPQYLLIKGKNNGTFCAQRYTRNGSNNDGEIIHTTRFFKLMSNEEKLEDTLQKTQEKATEIIKEYETTIETQRKEIEQLKKMVRRLSKKK